MNVVCKWGRIKILEKNVTSNKFDETSTQTILKKSIDAAFVEPATETLYQAYAWKHFRLLYAIAGVLLFLFTFYLSATMTYISKEIVSSTLLISLLSTSFILQILLMSFWKREQEPKYLNALILLLSTLMSAIYVIFVEPMPDEFHETLITLCFINSFGMIFLSNGRFYLILLNITILILPMNVITIIYHQHYSFLIVGPIYIGLTAFLVYLDNYSRRVTRLNWFRQNSMDKLNEELTRVAQEAVEDKTRVEEAAAQNVQLMEDVFYAKERAEKQNKFLSNLIEGIPLGITVLDQKANIVQINRQAVDLIGIADEKETFKKGKALKAMIDDLRSREGHHSPRFWKSYDKIIEQKMNPEKGKSAPLIKSDFKLDSGVFLSFMEVPISNDQNILITQDITYRKEIEVDMRQLALTDSLTGLANRHAFYTKFEDAIKRNARNKTSLGLAIIDLDKFKAINDTHGHPVGDKILQYVGDTLRDQIRTVDLPCRLGGDEFAVLFTDIMPDNPPTIACHRILEALNKVVEIDDLSLELGASIGLSFTNSPDIEPEQMIAEADRALYLAKESGRGSLEIVQTTI